MRTWNASTRAELDAALDAASGGDKIVLSPGQYGSLNLKNVEFDDFVTITSADPDNEARFTGIQVSGSEYIRFDDIHVDSPSNGSSGGGFVYIRDESSHIQIINSEINGSVDNVFEGGFGVRVKDASDIVFSNNYIHDVNHGVSFFSVDDLVVSENYFDRVMSDSMKFGGVSGALIENNWGAQFFDATPDAHVDFIQFQASATDTIIRGNVLLGQEYDGGKVYQGIFMSGGGVYKNVLVENNIIHTNTVNGILMNAAPGSDDVVIQNNTVISDVEDSKWDKATIRIVEFDGTMTVRNNVADDFWLGGASDLKQSGNVQVQFLDPSKANHYDNYFANATKSGTVTLEDLVPVAGSGIEFGSGVGAEQRLAELLDGDGSYGTPPDPLPIDEVPGTGDSGAGSDDDGETGDSSGSDAPPPPPPPPPAPEPDPEPEPPAAESPAPEPPAPEEPDDQTDGAYGTLYALNRKIDVRGKSDVIVIEHTSKMEVDSANIAFTFVADKVNGTRGLISKDASDYDGGGHHFSTYIKKGELFVRAQDKDSSETINLGEVEVGEEYSVKVAFGDGVVSASLNEAPAIEVDFEMDWTYNVQDLQIGALGWASKSGDSAFRNTFDGEIYDLSITTGEEDDGSTPGDQPPDSGSGVPGLVYSLDGPLEISSKTDVVVVNHNADLEIDAGTIAMSFIADKTWGMQGLLSKDAKGYAGGGNHFVAYLRGDDLHVRFQSEDDSQEFVARNAIESGTEHDLVATFGDGEVGVYLDGALIGSAAFEMDWQENDQQMQVGGNGWASSSGSSSFSQQFDGTISNVAIYDSVVPSDQFELLL